MTKPRKVVLGLFLAGALGCLMLVGWHYHLEQKVEKHKAALIAQGEFLSLTQAWPKPLTGDSKRAVAFSSAVVQLQGGTVLRQNQVPSMRAVRPGRAMAGSLRPEIRQYGSGQTNTWSDLAEELQSNEKQLEILRECLSGGPLDFNLNYGQAPRPHLAQAKQAAQTFWMAAALALHNKDLPAAHTNLMTLLSLSQALHHDRLLISELVEIAIGYIGASATWEALQTAGWTDAQLKQLQDKWLSLQFVEPMEDGFAMERALLPAYVQDWRESPQQFSTALDPLGGLTAPTGTGAPPGNLSGFLEQAFGTVMTGSIHFLWKYFWSYEDELRCLQISQVHVQTLRQTNLSWKAAQALIGNGLKPLGIQPPWVNGDDDELFSPKIFAAKTLLSEMVLNTERCIQRAFTAETIREIVATALALERFRLRHASYPSELSQLVPEFMARLPVDPMDGQALRYRLENTGRFTLYSVGPDGQDGKGLIKDEAQKSRTWTQEADWVWPSLATSEDIADYEARHSARQQKRAASKPSSTGVATNAAK